MNRLKFGILAIIVLSLFSCESIEDTYKEYSEGGKIKYVGKCESFDIKLGFKRFIFEWQRNPDANIKEIHISWKCDTGNGIFVIPATESSYSTDAIFEDMIYTIECYAVDKDGNKSIPIVKYERPFTETHELIVGYPKVVNKYFYVGNNKTGYDLVVFLDAHKEQISSAYIEYYRKDGKHKLTIDKALCDIGYCILDDIDITKDVTISRVAEVSGCLDIINFAPIELKKGNYNLNFDFIQQLQDRYNLIKLPEDFITKTEVLELDYSLKSLEDVMYFTNLKKIILGSNRFTIQPSGSAMILSTLTDINKSVLALEKVYNKLGVELVIHNNHYNIQNELPFTEKKDNPVLPTLEYLATDNWIITSSTNENVDGEDPATPKNILDNNANTLWAPQSVKEFVRAHELIIDMQNILSINGFKVTQALQNIEVAQIFYTDILRIKTSYDGAIWEEALYQVQPTIGTNYGESTVLYLPEAKMVRYIKVIISDKVDIKTKRNNVCLGDFMVF